MAHRPRCSGTLAARTVGHMVRNFPNPGIVRPRTAAPTRRLTGSGQGLAQILLGGPRLGDDEIAVLNEIEAARRAEIEQGMTVVSRNVEDFERAGIQTLNPFTG